MQLVIFTALIHCLVIIPGAIAVICGVLIVATTVGIVCYRKCKTRLNQSTRIVLAPNLNFPKAAVQYPPNRRCS